MKKIITTLAVSLSACAVMAQGTVQWTGVAGLFIAQTNSTQYSTFGLNGGAPADNGSVGATLGSGITSYYYELLVSQTAAAAPTSVSALASWTDTTLSAVNGAGSNGRILQQNASTQAAAVGWAAGQSANVILVGWSANLGTTWGEALNILNSGSYGLNSFFGVSSMGTLTSGTANPGVIVFGTGAGNINNGSGNPMQMYLLAPVPEPGTIALAALGGASLLLFRRRK
jgi:hypothetical protein